MDVVSTATDTALTGLIAGGAAQLAKRAKPGIEGQGAMRLVIVFAAVMGALQWAGSIVYAFQVIWAGVAAVVSAVFLAMGQFESYKSKDPGPPDPPPEPPPAG